MTTIQEYLENKLKQSSLYIPKDEDRLYLKKNGIENYILWKLMSKKFRKWKLFPECLERTKKAIKIAVTQNRPLHAVYFFGGYKLWRLPSSPQVDWAEFFNMSYILSYIAPVAALYKPGIDLYYFIHTLLMEKHDNLTIGEIDEYLMSFQKLMSMFSLYLPKNISFNTMKDSDFYTREEYSQALEEGLKQAEADFKNFPQNRKDHYLKLGRLNIKWKGKENWDDLSTAEKEQKIIKGALYEIAASQKLTKMLHAAKGEDKVLLFTVPTKDFIGIGSTKTSIVKPWTGTGIIEEEKNVFYERILSPSQFEKVKGINHKSVSVGFIPLKNLKQISIYSTRFNFI